MYYQIDKTKSNIQSLYKQYNQCAQQYNQYIQDNNLNYQPLPILESYTSGQQLPQVQIIQSGFMLEQQLYQLTKLIAKIHQAQLFIGQVIPILKGLYKDTIITFNGYVYQKLDGGSISSQYQNLYNIYSTIKGDNTLIQTQDMKILSEPNPYTYSTDTLTITDEHQQKIDTNTYTFDSSDIYPEHTHNVFSNMPISSASISINKVNNPQDFTDTFAHKWDGLNDTKKIAQTQTTETIDTTDVFSQPPIEKQQQLPIDVSDPHLQVDWYVCIDVDF